jgi:ornithine cyclodeaminase
VILLHDRATGFPTALVQATHLTALRTAAGSAVATDCFARPDAAVLSVFGAGLQADQHARAVLCVRNIRTVHIVNRTASRAMGLAARLRSDFPAVEFVVHATAADSSPDTDSTDHAAIATAAATALSATLRSSHVICTTTSSSTAVLRLADVSPGAHINAVGGFRPHMHELESALVSACRIAVDCPAALHSGDLLTPTTRGLIRAEEIRQIGHFIDRRKYAHRLRDGQRGDIGFELRLDSATEPEVLRTSAESVTR